MDLNAELIVVSDIHLVNMTDKRGSKLLSFLDSIEASDVKHLVLLGDIFDFCLGSTSHYKRKFASLGFKLQKIDQSGTKVTFIEGNHEFDLPKIGWQGVEIVQKPQTILELSDKTTVALAHGDLINSNRRYRWFRKFIKSKFVMYIVARLPHRLLDAIATNSAKVSRASDAYRRIKHEPILNAAEQWKQSAHADHSIFGHFHIPYAEKSTSGGLLLSLNSWNKPNFLLYKNQNFYRGHWSRDQEGPIINPVKPLLSKRQSE